MCEAAARGARSAGAEVTRISLGKREIRPCMGYACDACRRDGACVIKDDFQDVYQQVAISHGIVIGAPVYVGGVPAQLKAFMERFRAQSIGCLFRGEPEPMRNKVGGALTVGIHPYGGQEFVIAGILGFFLAEEMIVVGGDTPHAYYGAAAESGSAGPHPCPPDTVCKSESAMMGAESVGRRVAEVAAMVCRSQSG